MGCVSVFCTDIYAKEKEVWVEKTTVAMDFMIQLGSGVVDRR